MKLPTNARRGQKGSAMNSNETTTQSTTNTTSKYHAAVNFVPSDSKTVLVRLKELGKAGLTVKVPTECFGEVPPVKHESFILEAGQLFQLGNYLIPSNPKILDREMSEAKPYDVQAALAAAREEAPF